MLGWIVAIVVIIIILLIILKMINKPEVTRMDSDETSKFRKFLDKCCLHRQ